MAKPVRQSQISRDACPLGVEAKKPPSQNEMNVTGQPLRAPQIDKSGDPNAKNSTALVGPQRGLSFSKKQPRQGEAAAKLRFDELVPEWARTDLKVPKQASARIAAGSTGHRPPLAEPFASAVDRSRRAPLLTVRQAAEQLNVSLKTIRRLIARDELTAVRIGRSVRVHQEALDQLILGGVDN